MRQRTDLPFSWSVMMRSAVPSVGLASAAGVWLHADPAEASIITAAALHFDHIMGRLSLLPPRILAAASSADPLRPTCRQGPTGKLGLNLMIHPYLSARGTVRISLTLLKKGKST